MMERGFACLVISMLLFVTANSVDAAIIDVNPPGLGSLVFAPPVGALGQSFVAEDSLLGTIAFAFQDLNRTNPNTPITVSLLNGGGLSGSLVASVVQTLPSVLPDPMEFFSFDFSGTSLTVGATYTAVLSTNSIKVAVHWGLDVYS